MIVLNPCINQVIRCNIPLAVLQNWSYGAEQYFVHGLLGGLSVFNPHRSIFTHWKVTHWAPGKADRQTIKRGLRNWKHE